MVHDITNPPLAARFFAYSCLSGYEIVAQNDSSIKSMYNRLNKFPVIEKPDSVEGSSYQLAALLAMMETAKKLQPSGSRLEIFAKKFLDSCKQIGINDHTISQSLHYASQVSKKVLLYAKADGYNLISNYPRYTPVKGEGYWFPTPPAFLSAVEPYFNKVRSFTLDSASQFIPPPPAVFSTNKKSDFFKMLTDLHKERIGQDAMHKEIAAFWDCNPFAVQDKGHLQVGLKKISPGAHWLGITGIGCLQAKKTFNVSMQIHTAVSIGMMDAFITCWDEKFRSNRIRPETAIRKHIDPNWTPLLQTPPFPEYLSGHSVVSSSSATILTHFFGDNYSYTDSVEVSYGLPPRTFTSFLQAADEAGVSRFYGGIHFMDAVNNGRIQGVKVGEWVISKIK
ncbi:MAG: phosphatase PAP2 family protein [Niabella sp.]|nr:MAG: phosphatase PAP2 family protein [Niabella sp.]